MNTSVNRMRALTGVPFRVPLATVRPRTTAVVAKSIAVTSSVVFVSRWTPSKNEPRTIVRVKRLPSACVTLHAGASAVSM